MIGPDEIDPELRVILDRAHAHHTSGAPMPSPEPVAYPRPEISDLHHEIKAAADAIDLADQGKNLGPPIRPETVPDMSVSAVLYWIATKGGASSFNVTDAGPWQAAWNDVLMRGDVKILGLRFGHGPPEVVDRHAFVGAVIEHPYQQDWIESVFADKPKLECCGLVDDAEAGRLFNDKLFSGYRRLAWSHLRIMSCDVVKHWSFEEQCARATAPPRRGRRLGTGLQVADAPFMPEMNALLTSGEARSPDDAARLIVKSGRVKGAGTFESKQTRLAKRYRKQFDISEGNPA